MSRAPFENNRALIYGAATGIGAAVAMEFARRGAAIAIADLNLQAAEETAAAITASGGKAFALKCDVLSEDAVRYAAVQAERELGEVGIVMNNVGGIITGNPEDIPASEWHRIMNLNFFPGIYSNTYFLPKMIARRSGHVVNTASFAGMYPFATSRMPYAAAKAAVIALSESLALYLEPQGVRVSCLCPGPVATNVMHGMKTWSREVTFMGPGSHYKVKTAEDVATILADGMRDGRVMIPSDESVWGVVERHAAGPDAFIKQKIDEVARGDYGMPTM